MTMPWDISGVLRGPAIVVYFEIRTGVCPQFPDDIFLLTVTYAETRLLRQLLAGEWLMDLLFKVVCMKLCFYIHSVICKLFACLETCQLSPLNVQQSHSKHFLFGLVSVY